MGLRDYQQKLFTKTRLSFADHKAVVLCAPTGAGKTFIFSKILEAASKKRSRCLVITDRLELMKQAGGALNGLNLDFTEAAQGKEPDFKAQIACAMIETLSRRIKKDPVYKEWVSSFDLIIIDECHMASFNKLYPFISDRTFTLGVTATPSPSEFYKHIVQDVQISELIDLGFLATPKPFGLDVDMTGIKTRGGDFDNKQFGERLTLNQKHVGCVVNWFRLAEDTKTLCFCSSVDSSKALAAEFNRRGKEAKHLDGKTPKKERQAMLDWFDKNPKAILCNVGILTKGFDQPDIETVILYRATKILSLFLQMVGRGGRIAKGKTSFTILDYGGNWQRFGGWDKDRTWSLKKKDKLKGVAPVRFCDKCEFIQPLQLKVCPECGHVHPAATKKQILEFMKLHPLSPEGKKELLKAGDLEQLAMRVRLKELNPIHIMYSIKSYKEIKRFVRFCQYNPLYLYQLERRGGAIGKYLRKLKQQNND